MTWQDDYAAHLFVFGTPQRMLVRGEGPWVWDETGKRYLDLLGGIAVNVLGHAHPAFVAAVDRQLRTLGHISNFFTSPPQLELARRLLELAGAPEGSRVFLTNSGTEANEAAVKMALRHRPRGRMIALEDSFHGRTLGSLALTAKAAYREPFEPLPGDVTFVPFGDAEALAAAVDDSTAAVVLETIQGESGVVVPPDGYLAQVRAVTRQHGALLWVDEVQTGIGRCGEWLTSVADGLEPDLITVAKGLGNGVPIGACLAIGPAGELFTPGSHGSTFGGNPVAAAAGLAVLDVIEVDGLLERSRSMGEYLSAAVLGLGHRQVLGVRGRGLLRGIEIASEIAPQVADAILDAGWIINAPRPALLRLAPPLIVTAEVIDEFAAALARTLDAVGGND